MHSPSDGFLRIISVIAACAAVPLSSRASAQPTCDPPRMVMEASYRIDASSGLGPGWLAGEETWTRDALFPPGEGEFLYGTMHPTEDNGTGLYGLVRWNPASSGGTIEVAAGAARYDDCCTFADTWVRADVRFWVRGGPGTRYKIRRTIVAREVLAFAEPNVAFQCSPGFVSRISPIEPEGSIVPFSGATSTETKMFDGETYSLAYVGNGHIEASSTITQQWAAGFCGPHVYSYILSRYLARYEILPPDPVTFVLTIGANDTGPGGWQRGAVAAQNVLNAFARCDTGGPLSLVQTFMYTVNSGDGDGTQIAPGIAAQINAIRSRALPGDTLLVYVEAHGFSAPVGNEPEVVVRYGQTNNHPQIDYVTTGQEHLLMHQFTGVTPRPQSSYDIGRNLEVGAAIPGNLSEMQFAALFSGGVLNCMNKLFIMGQCHAGGFANSLLALEGGTALVAASPENEFSFAADTGGVGKLSNALVQVIGATPCPTPGTSNWLNMASLLAFLKQFDNAQTYVGPTFRLDAGWWDEDVPGPHPASYSVVANRSFASAAFPMCVADVVGVGGSEYRDGLLTADDVIAFLTAYFATDLAIADVASLGGTPAADGMLTADDMIVFLNVFINNCR